MIQNYISFTASDHNVLDLQLQAFLGPLQLFMSTYVFDSSLEHVDAVFLAQFLTSFLTPPYASLRVKNTKNTNCARGKIDVVVGQLCNGSKPQVNVVGTDSQIHKLYVATINEAKNYAVRQSGRLPDSRVPDETDLKTIYQPICELAAFSELCTFPCDEIPLINIFGSRYTFRPFLYFRKYDVLLTTSTPFTFLC